MNVFIIIPTQGKDTQGFKNSADALDIGIYSRAAKYLRTTLTDDGQVSFTVDRTIAFNWETAHNVDRVLTISHSGPIDGPNLAYGTNIAKKQPWPAASGDANQLSSEGHAFWSRVGRAMNSQGKIILLGCNMGMVDSAYASKVAKSTGKRVFAATGPFWAADGNSVLAAVGPIESNGKGTLRQF